MGLIEKLLGELIDIIQWTRDDDATMVYRFPRYGHEIKHGAKLVVREGQAAVFVNEGQLADVFTPGTYTLTTQNLPILATLKGWKYGFNSPFKAEVYFMCTQQFTDQKWGTVNPVMMRDAEFGPIRLRAFGNYSMRIHDPAVFIREIVGTSGEFTTEQIAGQIRNLIVTRFSDHLGESKIPALDLAANYNELSAFIQQRMQDDFAKYGLQVVTFLVENISLPPAVEEAIDKRTSMGVVGNLQAYTQFQAANAMETAAANPSGLAAGGMGMGMGFAMANQMTQSMQAGAPSAAPSAPPPAPPAAFFVAVNGQQAGPFDLAALGQQAVAGRLTLQTLVWKSGMPAWLAVAQVPELAALFPPPLPPGAPPPLPGAR
jgi:membrane protease subunit (stomatin/prohibitin family)